MSGSESSPIDWDADRRLPFASLFDERVRAATAALTPPVGFADSALDDLATKLRSDLAAFASPVLCALFAEAHPNDVRPADRTGQSDAAYQRFVRHHRANGSAQIERDFPVLAEVLDLCQIQWVASVDEALTCIGDARASLEAHLAIEPHDEVVHASIGLGDRHAGGRTVGSFTTASGAKFVFKPRSVRSESMFFELWSEFRRRVADPLPVPTVIDLEAVGIVEHVSPAAVHDTTAYWRRAGELAGLLHLCVAGDMHHENVIAAGAQPIPIDLEVIDQPELEEPSARRDLVDDSVLATGLFPHRFRDHWGGPVDLAGLFAGVPEMSVQPRMFWQHLGTDDIGQRRLPYTRNPEANVARDREGAPVACDLPALLEGLDRAWKHGPELVSSTGDWGPVRHLRCGTKAYVETRASMLEIDALQDRELFERRSRELPPIDTRPEAAAEILRLESAALQRLDIPLHRVEGRSFIPDGGEALPDVFAMSGADRRRERVQLLATAGSELHSVQVSLAVEQFDGSRLEVPFASRAEVAPGAGAGTDEALAAAIAIGHGLLDRRFRTPDGDAWLEVDQRSPMRAVADNTSLHAGTDGIGLFFAALAAATGDAIWADACRAALASGPVPERERSRPWFETGWAGRVYARAACGRMLDDAQLVAEATRVLAEGPPKDPEASDPLDLMGGWGGVLLAMLSVESMGIEAADRASALADWLLDEIERRQDDPVSAPSVRRMGVAHGVTGLAFVLARASVELGHVDAARVARQLASAEEVRIRHRNGVPGSLQGLGAEKTPKLSWCWGVTGYAMARSHPSWRAIADAPSHVDEAAAILASAPRDRSHACCGEAGQLMALSELAQRSGSRQVADAASRLRSNLIAMAATDGPWYFYDETSMTTPGLYWGTAGVGYALLHNARPHDVPNYLMIDPHVG